MLSDEEMKAIEDLKDMIEKSKDLMEEEFYKLATIHNIQAVATILNLIKKQSKEIEEYKKQLDLDNECEIALNNRIMDLEKEIEELKDTRSIFNMGRRSYKNEIEDKIKAMIENEIINISGFECVAKEDVQSLLEKE